MSEPTPEELLRLARKAWPSVGARVRQESGSWLAEDDDTVVLWHPDQSRFHAALLVLAGESDTAALQAQNAALLAERDRLRERLACVGRFDATGDGNSRCAGCGFAVRGEPRRLTVTLPKEVP